MVAFSPWSGGLLYSEIFTPSPIRRISIWLTGVPLPGWMFSAVRTTYSLPSCSMMLPLRIELAMTFKAIFPNFWPQPRPDIGVRGVHEAVSGCNILILAVDASVLPVLWAAPIRPETARFDVAYFRFGAG